MKLISIGMRTFHVFHWKPFQLEECFDNGGGGDFVDEAAEDLVGSGDEELVEFDSLHQVIFVCPGGQVDQVTDGTMRCGVLHSVFLTNLLYKAEISL